MWRALRIPKQERAGSAIRLTQLLVLNTVLIGVGAGGVAGLLVAPLWVWVLCVVELMLITLLVIELVVATRHP